GGGTVAPLLEPVVEGRLTGPDGVVLGDAQVVLREACRRRSWSCPRTLGATTDRLEPRRPYARCDRLAQLVVHRPCGELGVIGARVPHICAAIGGEPVHNLGTIALSPPLTCINVVLTLWTK